jgi:hypothetical protein
MINSRTAFLLKNECLLQPVCEISSTGVNTGTTPSTWLPAPFLVAAAAPPAAEPAAACCSSASTSVTNGLALLR